MSDTEVLVVSCDPADARRSQVSGPASVKLVTDGRAGVDDQAPVADNITGSTVNAEEGPHRSSSLRKRPRDRASKGGSGLAGQSSDEDGLPAPKLQTGRRGRQASKGASTSRPRRDAQGRFVRSNAQAASEAKSDVGVTTEDPGGESGASLGSSKAELNAARREQRKAVAADEVSAMAERARERRAALTAEGGEPSAAALSQLALDGVDLTASDEVAKLQEHNGRLRADLEDLRRQVAALSEQQQRRAPPSAAAPVVAPSPAPRPASARSDDEVERIVRLCMLQCGSMVNARIRAVSRRLPPETLRPPLAADGRRRMEEPPRSAPRQGKPTGGVKKEDGAPPSAQPTTPGSKGESWATVVGRKKARKAAKADSAAARAPGPTAKAAAQPARRTAKGGRKRPTVRALRSEAVTLTLQPGAAKRGVTYQSVIAEAKAKIKSSDLGLQWGHGCAAVRGGRCCERQR
ncbi:uncharacterized protein LOC113502050 [Trichoplusia ni]|uniref:Uncharacterized protein LOC113502050 n=1 Tax=Trichoplusia ni TaxID=7111 RepID=A0A7E5WEV2_TRINI|nr:uncharacterized protein LOC113502050 [Trichoplusia ni]